jgi:hypothetical protein
MNLLDALAAARPAQLDPPSDPARRSRHLAAALARPPAADTAAVPAPAPHAPLDLTTPARGTPAHARRGRRRWTGLAVGAVAAGAAVAVAVAVLPGKTGSQHPVVRAQSDAFLLAASKAELLPTGNYWATDLVLGQSYVVPAKTGTVYAVDGTGTESFSWVAAKNGGGDRFYSRELPFRTWTAADRAAWQAAGSPRTLKVWAGDHYDVLVSKASSWHNDGTSTNPGGEFYLPADPSGRKRRLTRAQLENLPADPAKLAKIVFPATTLPSGAKPRPLVPAQRVIAIGALLRQPITPKVQAALMRLLATQPGVRRVGTVTDPLGRKGVAVAGAWSNRPGYKSEEQLVFDAKTGAYLAGQEVLTTPGGIYKTQKPGFVIFYAAMRRSGWTDAKPAPPKGLPY